MRGVILSLDALIAVGLFLSMAVLSGSFINDASFTENNSLLLKQSALDSATVLEKSGILESAVVNNDLSGVRGFLNRLPNSLCAETIIFRSSDTNNSLFSVLRDGCTSNDNSAITINRSFITGNHSDLNFYIARTSTWRRPSQ